YHLPKWFSSESHDPEPTKTTALRLGKLALKKNSFVIVQDGYRPDFERLAKEHQQGITREMAGIKSLDVRAVAHLWDSYMHVLVGVDEQGIPRVKRIEEIRRDGKPIFIGQGAQAALARRILCQYGIFASMDEAREAFKPPTDPVAQANDL